MSINLSKNEKLLYTFVNQTIIFILTVQFKAAITLQLIITSTLFKRRQKSKVEFKHLLHFHKAYLSTKSKTWYGWQKRVAQHKIKLKPLIIRIKMEKKNEYFQETHQFSLIWRLIWVNNNQWYLFLEQDCFFLYNPPLTCSSKLKMSEINIWNRKAQTMGNLKPKSIFLGSDRVSSNDASIFHVFDLNRCRDVLKLFAHLVIRQIIRVKL